MSRSGVYVCVRLCVRSCVCLCACLCVHACAASWVHERGVTSAFPSSRSGGNAPSEPRRMRPAHHCTHYTHYTDTPALPASRRPAVIGMPDSESHVTQQVLWLGSGGLPGAAWKVLTLDPWPLTPEPRPPKSLGSWSAVNPSGLKASAEGQDSKECSGGWSWADDVGIIRYATREMLYSRCYTLDAIL